MEVHNVLIILFIVLFLLASVIWIKLTSQDCLVSLVVLSATATLEILGSNLMSSKSVIGFFYEILSSNSELGYVPGKLQ